MSTDAPAEKPDADPGAEAKRAFARALNEELDRVGYPAPPARTNQLAEDLGVGRVQAFRTLRGDILPPTHGLLKLHRLGVSIDAVFEQFHGSTLDEVLVTILGVSVKAVPIRAHARAPFGLSLDAETPALRALGTTGAAGSGEIPIGGLRFTRTLPTVAVIEDDPGTLTVISAELEQAFNVAPFQNEKAFLKRPSRLASFDAVVLDWVLPATDGATVVEFIRSNSRAPIIVITGHREESTSIGAILALPELYYAAKPVDGEILRAMLAAAINKNAQTP